MVTTIHKFFPENLVDIYSIVFLGPGKTEIMKNIYNEIKKYYKKYYYMKYFDSEFITNLVHEQKNGNDNIKILIAIDDNSYCDKVMFDKSVNEILSSNLNITLLVSLNYLHLEHNFDYYFIGARCQRNLVEKLFNFYDVDMNILDAIDQYTFLIFNKNIKSIDEKIYWYRTTYHNKDIVNLLNY